MTKKDTKAKFEHDEKTCFRCRLHALFDELYPNRTMPTEDQKFVIMSLAEASGQLLASCEEDLRFMFITSVMRPSLFDEDDDENEGTRH